MERKYQDVICLLAASVIILPLISSMTSATELKKMKVELVPEGEGQHYVVTDPSEALLVVHSSIDPLQFESTLGIILVERRAPGEYWLHLHPGTNLVTFKAEEYMPLQVRYFIDKRTFKEVRVAEDYGIIPPEGKGGIRIISDPAGARIEIDGIRASEVTPYENNQLPSGVHSLKIAYDENYLEVDTVARVMKDRVTELNVSLIRKKGTVSITSEPPGADIYVNGKRVGTAPYTLLDYPTGRYNVEARLEGYLSASQDMQITYQGSEQIKITLSRLGGMSIITTPPGAGIYLNGNYRGVSPLELRDLGDGIYSVEARLDEFTSQAKNARVQAGAMAKVNLTLEKKPQSDLSWAGDAGSWEIGWSGHWSYSKGEALTSWDKGYMDYALMLALKKFAFKNFAIGGFANWYLYDEMKSKQSSGHLDLGAALTYYFRKNSDQIIVPFLDAKCAYDRNYGKEESGSSYTWHGFQASSGLGVAFFITPTVALKPTAQYSWEFPRTGDYVVGSGTSRGFEALLELSTYSFPKMRNYDDPAWGRRYKRAAKINQGSFQLGVNFRFTHQELNHNTSNQANMSWGGGNLTLGGFLFDRFLLGLKAEHNSYKIDDAEGRAFGVGPFTELYFPFSSSDNTKTYVGAFYKIYNARSDAGFSNFKTEKNQWSLWVGLMIFANPSWAWSLGYQIDFVKAREESTMPNWYSNNERKRGTVNSLYSGIHVFF